MHVCLKGRSQFYFRSLETRSLTELGEFPSWARLTDQHVPHVSTFLATGLESHAGISGFLPGFWGWVSGPHTYITNALQNEQTLYRGSHLPNPWERNEIFFWHIWVFHPSGHWFNVRMYLCRYSDKLSSFSYVGTHRECLILIADPFRWARFVALRKEYYTCVHTQRSSAEPSVCLFPGWVQCDSGGGVDWQAAYCSAWSL